MLAAYLALGEADRRAKHCTRSVVCQPQLTSRAATRLELNQREAARGSCWMHVCDARTAGTAGNSTREDVSIQVGCEERYNRRGFRVGGLWNERARGAGCARGGSSRGPRTEGRGYRDEGTRAPGAHTRHSHPALTRRSDGTLMAGLGHPALTHPALLSSAALMAAMRRSATPKPPARRSAVLYSLDSMHSFAENPQRRSSDRP